MNALSPRQYLSQRCEERHLQLPPARLDRLLQYVDLLLHWGRHLNLTGLRTAEGMIDVLIAESFDFLQRSLLPAAARVLDLGTGAGVPGIPLAICAPDLHLTLLDRTEKKITFLRRAVLLLQLENCQPLCSTAEALGRRVSPAPYFDAVVSRGVGRVAHVLSLARPLLRPGGLLLLRKPAATSELQESVPLLAAGAWRHLDTLPLFSAPRSPWVLLIFEAS